MYREVLTRALNLSRELYPTRPRAFIDKLMDVNVGV